MKKIFHFIGLKIVELLAIVSIFFVFKYGIQCIGYLLDSITFPDGKIILYTVFIIAFFIIGMLLSLYVGLENDDTTSTVLSVITGILSIFAIPLAFYSAFWLIIADAFFVDYMMHIIFATKLSIFVSYMVPLYFMCGVFFLIIQFIIGVLLYNWLKLNYLIVKYKRKDITYMETISIALKKW